MIGAGGACDRGCYGRQENKKDPPLVYLAERGHGCEDKEGGIMEGGVMTWEGLRQ